MTESMPSPIGTFRCPICQKDSPHPHNLNKWIGVDFDGTLAHDTVNRKDPYELGEPIIQMVNRVKDWIAKGFEVRIFTARMHPYSYTAGIERDPKKMEAALKSWCKKHIGVELVCTNAKDGMMEVLWDDRTVRVIAGTGTPDL